MQEHFADGLFKIALNQLNPLIPLTAKFEKNQLNEQLASAKSKKIKGLNG